MRVVQKIDRIVAEQLRAEGLTLAQFDVLAHVGAHEGLTQQALADGLLVTKGNVTQLLTRLEGRGLLERQPEGRSKRLFLTAAGRALYQRVIPRHEALIAAQFKVLLPSEQRGLLRLVRRLDQSLGR
ncbi:MAG: hypothetical protein QOF51_697 [Chloroflexota bacterium]|jgi:DNA-binding MarR family transcriptional regulator|nr:hypothetical protein [Chloroflexota bacterium]